MRWVKMYRTQLSRRAAGKTSETQQTQRGSTGAGSRENPYYARTTLATLNSQLTRRCSRMRTCRSARMHARQTRIRAGKTQLYYRAACHDVVIEQPQAKSWTNALV